MRIMRLLKRFLYSIVAVVLLVSLFLIADSAGVFFNEMSEGIADYNVITESQLKNKLPVQGTVYTVYDCIAIEYDSESGDDTAYYYLIEFDEDQDRYMILQTKAGSQLDDDIDALCDAYFSGDNDSLLQKGVEVDGILVENDSDVVKKFDEWKDDLNLLGEDTSNYSLVAYTYDCSYTVESYHNDFLGGSAVIIAALAVLITVIVISVKRKKKNTAAAPIPGNYMPPQNFGQPNNFGVPNQYNQQPNMYGQNNYPQNIPQSNIPQPNIPQPYIPQSNIPQPGFPQSANMNPNPQNPNGSAFVPSSVAAPSVQDVNQTPTMYAAEQKISLDKKDY